MCVLCKQTYTLFDYLGIFKPILRSVHMKEYRLPIFQWVIFISTVFPISLLLSHTMDQLVEILLRSEMPHIVGVCLKALTP